jgi:peroxiredoxin family protein/TusA-related sulfurtransferase/rhodanese-related sulfurtransferase
MAGYVADNILSKRVHVVSWRAVNDRSHDTVLVDVRTADEFALGSIAGAINIPVDDLRSRMCELSKEVPIVLFCAVGLRGYLAYRILSQSGFTKLANLSGGYKTYNAATSTVTPPPSTNNSAPNTPMKHTSSKIIQIDACGLQCPGPVMQLKKEYEQLEQGAQLSIKATDQGFAHDVSAWCKMMGAKLVNVSNNAGVVEALIEKSEKQSVCNLITSGKENKTIIVFSDDLDKALASFVIANAAAATGKKVSLFFTFWGLSAIKKQQPVKVKKDLLGTMFSWMLPSNSTKFSLSKMNMGGLGGLMMRFIMKRKSIESLENLIHMAVENNVEMIACTMSMDVMGIKKEELIDHVILGGAATYLERAEDANVNLFI